MADDDWVARELARVRACEAAKRATDDTTTRMSDEHNGRVLAALQGGLRLDVGRLALQTGLRVEEVHRALVRLWLDGRVERVLGTDVEQWTAT